MWCCVCNVCRVSLLGSKVKNWRRRYFALFPHTLKYYKRKGDVTAQGEILLGAGIVGEHTVHCTVAVVVGGGWLG